MANILVKATQLGFYDNVRRKPGDVFHLRDKTRPKSVKGQRKNRKIREAYPAQAQFSETWMVKVSGKPTTKAEGVAVPAASSVPPTGDQEVL